MSLSQTDAPLSAEELLDAARRLATPELARLTEQLVVLRAQRAAPSLPSREADLLRQINAITLPGDPATYAELIRRRQAEEITPQELDELVRITDAREEANARRIGLLAELAALRGVSLRDLMEELGLRPATNA